MHVLLWYALHTLHGIVYWLAWYVTWLKDSVCLCQSRMKIRLYIVLHGRVSYDIVWCGIQLYTWYHVVCYIAGGPWVRGWLCKSRIDIRPKAPWARQHLYWRRLRHQVIQ